VWSDLEFVVLTVLDDVDYAVEMGEPFVWSDLEFVVLTVLDDVDCAVEMGEPFVWSDLEFVVLTVLDDVDCAVEMVNRLCGVIWCLSFSLYLMMLTVEMVR